MILYVILNRVPLVFSMQNIISLCVMFIAYIYINDWNGIRFLFPCTIFLLLNDNDRKSCLAHIYKWYAWLMIPSIITYFLVQFIGIPSFGNLNFEGNDLMGWAYSHRQNYIFYAYSDFYNIRFNGPFLEPGHLGMISSLLLFATGIELEKKETWIIIISLILSLSLAGYILFFVAFLFSRYLKKLISLKYSLLSLLVIVVIYIGGILYNNGDNLLNENIFSRMEADQEKGISGNNRSSGLFLDYYSTLWENKKRLIWGIGRKEMRVIKESHLGGGIGFEVWMVTYGLVGTIFALLFYFSFFVLDKKKRIAGLFLIYITLMFLQRTYPFWYSWIICYVFGITYYKDEIMAQK